MGVAGLLCQALIGEAPFHVTEGREVVRRAALERLRETAARGSRLHRLAARHLEHPGGAEDVAAKIGAQVAAVLGVPAVSAEAVRIAGRFRDLGPLAEGGMSVARRARDPLSGQQVVVKAVPSGKASSLASLREEARILGRLRNPGIPRLVDAFQDESGAVFVVMPFIHGVGLREYAAESPMAEAVDAIVELCGIVGDLHEAGFLHLDIKPANVRVTPTGRVRLLDLGIAMRRGEAGRIRREPRSAATAAYAAPEQAEAMHRPEIRLDVAADVYALGVTLCELVSGRLPFEPSDAAGDDLLSRHREELPGCPSAWNPDVPPELDAVILRCLEKAPRDRFPTVAELAEALRPCVERLRQAGTPGAAAKFEAPPVPAKGRAHEAMAAYLRERGFTLGETPLGQGAFGTVWRAEGSSGPWAVKVLRDDLGSDERQELIRRMAYEKRCLENLKGAGAPRLIDGAPEQGFIVMELVEGETLDAASARRGLSAALGWCARVLDVLSAAHQKGMVHRDIKPSNVLVTGGGEVAVIDWGMGRPDAEAARMTRTGDLFGTPGFSAPFQLMGSRLERISPAVDLYALAATVYTLIAGRPPFEGRTLGEVLTAQREGAVLPLDDAARERGVPPELAAAVTAMLQAAIDQPPAAFFRAALEAAIPAVAAFEAGGGSPAPVAAYVEARTAIIPEERPFGDGRGPRRVGRENEWARLVGRLLDIEGSDGPRVVWLRGRTGSGRTRMLDDLRAASRIRGVTCLSVFPARDALTALRAAVWARLPGWRNAEWLSAAAVGGEAPLMDLLVRLHEERGPTVVLTDDGWDSPAEEAALRLLQSAVARVPGVRLFCSVLASAAGDLPRGGVEADEVSAHERAVESISLRSLDTEETHQVAYGALEQEGQAAPEPLAESAAAALRARCDGRPGLVVELLAHLHARGFVRERQGEADFRPCWEAEVPAATAARFQGVTSDDLLTHAACFLGPFSLRDVVALGWDEATALRGIERGSSAGVLVRVGEDAASAGSASPRVGDVSRDRFEFSCPLLRDARVAALSEPARQRLCAMAAEWLERSGVGDDMRLGRLRALAGESVRAVAAFEAAGRDRARSERAQLEAWAAAVELRRDGGRAPVAGSAGPEEQALGQGTAEPEDRLLESSEKESGLSDSTDGLVRALIEKCARLRRTYPDPASQAEALEGLREAVSLSEGGPAALRADARILLARALQGRDPGGAEATLEDVLADLGEGATPEEERARGLAHMQLGVVLRMRDPSRARMHLEAARPLLEGAEEWEWLASVWLSLGVLHQDEGRLRRAAHCFIRALRIAARHGLNERFGWSCNNLARVFVELRPRPRLALRYIDAAIPVVRETRNGQLLANLLLHRGICNHCRGHFEDAELDYISARREFEALDNKRVTSILWCNLAEVYSMQGAVERADAALYSALSGQRGEASLPADLEYEFRLQTGVVRLQQLRFNEAESEFARAASLAPPGERAPALARQAWASFRISGLSTATRQLLDAADKESTEGSLKARADAACTRARCLAAPGEASNRAESEELYRRAMRLYEQSRTAAWSLADARLGLGLLLADDPSRRTEARDCLQAALEAFMRMEELGVDRKSTRARNAIERLDSHSG
jgi:serine/threonine protein kinase/tetratricopeptide (TPR) repeat protein